MIRLQAFKFICVFFVLVLPIECLRVLNDDDISYNSPLPIGCLRCLSDVLTGNVLMDCSGNTEVDTCGLFKLTQWFWNDAFYIDKPSYSDSDKYKACALNAWCAAETVQRFTRRYLRDCRKREARNVSKVPLSRHTCESALGLILHGKDGCDQPLPSDASDRLHACLNKQMWGILKITD